jgi:hypothetical protein
MNMAEELLKRHDNLKVLHLFRDPRPVILSRTNHESFRAIYSKKNIGLESKFYCNIVEHDIKLRKDFERKFPGRVKEVIYEDFIKRPRELAKDIYKFLGIPFVQDVESWVIAKSNKPKSVLEHWSGKQSLLNTVETTCRDLYKYVSTVWEPISN